MAAGTPSIARAEERTESAPWVAPLTDPDRLRAPILDETREVLRRTQARLPVPGTATQELAVSREAKVIIIVCAIVVGVIILVGAFALSGPHRP
jgi:hypothetical protein